MKNPPQKSTPASPPTGVSGGRAWHIESHPSPSLFFHGPTAVFWAWPFYHLWGVAPFFADAPPVLQRFRGAGRAGRLPSSPSSTTAALSFFSPVRPHRVKRGIEPHGPGQPALPFFEGNRHDRQADGPAPLPRCGSYRPATSWATFLDSFPPRSSTTFSFPPFRRGPADDRSEGSPLLFSSTSCRHAAPDLRPLSLFGHRPSRSYYNLTAQRIFPSAV